MLCDSVHNLQLMTLQISLTDRHDLLSRGSAPTCYSMFLSRNLPKDVTRLSKSVKEPAKSPNPQRRNWFVSLEESDPLTAAPALPP